MNPDPWEQHVKATLDALWKAMGADSPFPWAPPGGLSEDKNSNEEGQTMGTVKVSAKEVKVGDIMWVGGTPRRITRIQPYVHPTIGEPWAIASSDGPEGFGLAAWGITLELTNPSEYYEITARG